MMLGMAWRFLRHDRAKSLGAVLGATVAVFLIGQQLGIGSFLVSAMVAPLRFAASDLLVVDAASVDVNALGQLDPRVPRQVASIAGVRRVAVLLLAPASARFSNGTQVGVTLMGATAPDFRGAPPLEAGATESLLRDGALGFDRFDRASFGNADIGSTLEINGQRALLSVRSAGVRAFAAPIMFGPIERVRKLAGLPTGAVNLVIVDVEPGTLPSDVAAKIDRTIAGVRAWDPPQLARATQKKLLGSSGIAASFGTLIVFAILVGFVIIGLTLYIAAVDRLRDYGTMKAIGARDSTITQLVLWQAVVVAVVGTLAGGVLLVGFQRGVRSSGVIFSLPPVIWLSLGFGTLFIAATGAAFAIRRLRGVEPAAVFRGF
jgi:putative ABC transport system permease protein